MQVEIVKEGVKIAGPFEYNIDRVRELIGSRGGDTRIIPLTFSGTFKVGNIDVKRVVEDRPEITKTQRHVFDSREETADAIIYHYIVADREVSELKRMMIGELSRIHDVYESKRAEHNGVLVNTDLEARIAIKDVLDRFNSGSLTSITWRGKVAPSGGFDPVMGGSLENGRIEITSTAEMQALYDTVIGYLSAGFAARQTLEDQINAATTLADLDAINIQSDWVAIAPMGV